MLAKIKGVRVVGTVTSNGRCPACNEPLIVHDKDGYRFFKIVGIAEYYNGEEYMKCKHCGQFVERPKVAV